LRFFIAPGSEKPKCCYRRHLLDGYTARFSRERVSAIGNSGFGEQVARNEIGFSDFR
jgi:hypothetical protein